MHDLPPSPRQPTRPIRDAARPAVRTPARHRSFWRNIMPDAAQYTLGLFDSSALGWTVPTPTASPIVSADADAEDEPHAPAALPPQERGVNFVLAGDRQLARGWPARARDNIAAIRLSKELEDAGRAPTAAEQERLLRFIGFGATDMAQNAFPLPGETDLRPGWEEIGKDLADATTAPEYAALQRSTQYAHYTPEPVIRAIWRAAQHLGFSAGRVLEPGMGTGLFFALMPEALRDSTRLTGIEYDPDHRTYRRPCSPPGPRAPGGLHAFPTRGRLRPCDRQSSVCGSGHQSRPVDGQARPPPARLLHRAFHRPAAARRTRHLRDQHRHYGQGQHRGTRAHREHGGPDRRGAFAREQHAGNSRHGGRDRRARVPAAGRGPSTQGPGLDGPSRDRAWRTTGRAGAGAGWAGRFGRRPRRPGSRPREASPSSRRGAGERIFPRASRDGARRAWPAPWDLWTGLVLHLPCPSRRPVAGSQSRRGLCPAALWHLHCQPGGPARGGCPGLRQPDPGWAGR